MYGPGTFQTAASAVGLGASEMVCGPFKCGVQFPLTLQFSGSKPSWFFKNRLWELILLCRFPRVAGGVRCGAVTSHFSGRTFAPVKSPPTWGSEFQGLVSDLTTSLSFSLLVVALSSYLELSKSCSESVQVILRESSSVCSCMGGGMLRSSYLAILLPPACLHIFLVVTTEGCFWCLVD